MNSKNSTYLNRLHWVFLLGFFLIVALPLISAPPWMHPPSFAKSIVFRIILSVLIFFFIWQFLSPQNGKKFAMVKRLPSKEIAFWLLVALFGVFLLATIFSLEPHFSFWGSPYRGDGFLTYSFYIIFAILAFLILRSRDWKKIWIVVFLIGIGVSLIAISQKFGLFSELLIPYDYRPISTLGGTNLLALYLLLLSFLPLSFTIAEVGRKRFFYLFSFLLFIFTLSLAASRAAFIGLFVGLFFFVFFYPQRGARKIVLLKIFVGAALLLGILGAFWLNNQPEIAQNLRENRIFGPAFHRTWGTIQPFLNLQDLSFGKVFTDLRFSGWKIAIQALKDRPLLGYGPENFSIGFDKYFDPSLPGIGNSWWDRAHNFALEIAVTAGIPALLIYLSLFGALLWQLQRVKYTELHREEQRTTQNTIIAHSIQATFLAYLTANFFSFDSFSTYLIFFLLVGYSLHLISEQKIDESAKGRNGFTQILTRIYADIFKWRGLIIFILVMGLVWFIYFYNIKPLQINKEVNWAEFYTQNKKCEKALRTMAEILPQKSYIDHFVRLSYADIIRDCITQKPEMKVELTQRATQILKENIEMRPYYTRDWFLLAEYTKFLAQVEKKESQKKELMEEASNYLKRANELSPKRPIILIPWIEIDLKMRNYGGAKEKAQRCIEIDPKVRECWWFKGVALVAFEEIKRAQEAMEKASELGHPVNSDEALFQLVNAYAELAKTTPKLEYYQTLVTLWQKLVRNSPQNFQRHASLACAYLLSGNQEKASKEAIIAIRSDPQWDGNEERLQATVNAFLANPEICFQ